MRCLALFNDILDFSKIEAGKMELERIAFAVREFIGGSVRLLVVSASKKGLKLACRVAPNVPAKVVGDPLRLRQILVNLVGNAIKFTERGEVLVDVSAEAESESRVVLHFAVQDTGIGISADKQQCIFEAFRQSDSSMTRRFGGTGLGLAISSQLVSLMDGRMWVESEPGAGAPSASRFRSTWPLRRTHRSRRKSTSTARKTPTPLRCLCPCWSWTTVPSTRRWPWGCWSFAGTPPRRPTTGVWPSRHSGNSSSTSC